MENKIASTFSAKKEYTNASDTVENITYSQLSNKSTRANTHFSNLSGHSKKINVSAFELDNFLDEAINYEKQIRIRIRRQETCC